MGEKGSKGLKRASREIRKRVNMGKKGRIRKKKGEKGMVRVSGEEIVKSETGKEKNKAKLSNERRFWGVNS